MRTTQRATTPIPKRASAAYSGVATRPIDTETPGETQALPQKERHWLTPLGCGALLVMGCVVFWSWWVVPTYTNVLDQWHYGDSHMNRLTVNLGQGQEDFLAFNQHGHIVVLEVNSTHPTTTRLYIPTGISLLNDSGNTIVTLSLADVNHDGKPDIVLHVEGQNYVLFNHGDSFSWSEK